MLQVCPCGSGKMYSCCCQPIIENRVEAVTAEELMRSRYSAFTFANVDYLMKSWHSKMRNLKEKKDIRDWARSVRWIKLEILEIKAGQANDVEGWVSFKAFYEENRQLKQIFEHSFFERECKRWVYSSGKHE